VYVLATIHAGQPMQLVNAFESPVRANGTGYEQGSVDRLLKHRDAVKTTWGLSYDLEVSVPERTFLALLTRWLLVSNLALYLDGPLHGWGYMPITPIETHCHIRPGAESWSVSGGNGN